MAKIKVVVVGLCLIACVCMIQYTKKQNEKKEEEKTCQVKENHGFDDSIKFCISYDDKLVDTCFAMHDARQQMMSNMTYQIYYSIDADN
jgi:hypothetical protein